MLWAEQVMKGKLKLIYVQVDAISSDVDRISWAFIGDDILRKVVQIESFTVLGVQGMGIGRVKWRPCTHVLYRIGQC